MSTLPVPLAKEIAVVKPWDRREGEPEEAWLAFRCYRDMQRPRNFTRSAVATTSRISEWAQRWDWKGRVDAYDQVFESLKEEEREALLRQSAREIAVQHMSLLADARDLVQRELSKLAEASRNTEMHGLLKAGELTKLMEVTVKLDRLVRDQSTENVAQRIDLSELSIDEVKELRRLHEKAGVPVG